MTEEKSGGVVGDDAECTGGDVVGLLERHRQRLDI